jgi:hypothetical protein
MVPDEIANGEYEGECGKYDIPFVDGTPEFG